MWVVYIGWREFCGCDGRDDADAVVRYLVRRGTGFVWCRFEPDRVF